MNTEMDENMNTEKNTEMTKEAAKHNTIEETVDVVVVGAGHAGCEAALACARLGLETIVFTVSVDSIALMPCNPNVGRKLQGTSGAGGRCTGRRNGEKYRPYLYPV